MRSGAAWQGGSVLMCQVEVRSGVLWFGGQVMLGRVWSRFCGAGHGGLGMFRRSESS